jgi:hypothetical protein
MAITQATSSVLAANAALNNLNAGASIVFTKPVTVANFTLSAGSTATFNATTYTYGTGAAAAHRTALGLSTLATTTPAANVATFLATPTSANLAAAVTDETGSGALVFANAPSLIDPTIQGNLIQSTVIKNGPVPYTQIFEDFPHGSNGSTSIGTHGWLASRTAGGSNGQWTAASASAAQSSWGTQFLTTAATLNAFSTFILGAYNGQSTSPYNIAFQVCFAMAQTSFCNFGLNFGGGGTDVSISLNFGTGELILTRPSVSLTLATGLSLSSGDFVTGTKYRLHIKPISTTQTEVWLASAPATSSTWTTLYDQIVTHTSSSLGWNCSTPSFGIGTQEAVAKTAYVDWASIVKAVAR